MMEPEEQGRFDANLKEYYRRLFPLDLIFNWLSYGQNPSHCLANREFAFILKNDIHLRYLSFSSEEDFREKLSQKCPHKIDIGAVYNRPPCDRKKVGEFVPVQRELVFDIDLTDYDNIRNCCSGACICTICWHWLVIAVQVLDNLLREHFGFTKLLWVFSGRRGIHCWVADEKALKLTNRAREAITKYLIFDKNGPVITDTRVHPMAEHSYRKIMDSGFFDHLVIAQKWLENEENWQNVLKLCDDENVREILDREFRSFPTSEMRWKSLKLRFDEVERKKYLHNQPGKTKLPSLITTYPAKHFLRYFVLTYAYPRLDEKVSIGINHLLKSPFSVHPKNGNIAVPLNPKTISRFQLANVPNIDKLSAELRKIDELQSESIALGSDETKNLYYKKTSLASYIETLQAFIENLSSETEKEN